MAARVAVVDPLPMYRQGVAGVLAAAGHVVDEPSDVLRWIRRRRSACVLLTVQTEREWELLDRLSAEPSAAVIALLDEISPTAGARAVRAGARSVLSRSTAGRVLLRTVEATIEGQSVIPPDAVLLLAAASPHDPAVTSVDRVAWLRHLAAGGTVTELADRLGYSERAMYRLLHGLPHIRLHQLFHASSSRRRTLVAVGTALAMVTATRIGAEYRCAWCLRRRVAAWRSIRAPRVLCRIGPSVRRARTMRGNDDGYTVAAVHLQVADIGLQDVDWGYVSGRTPGSQSELRFAAVRSLGGSL